jgi:hypothetical protein
VNTFRIRGLPCDEGSTICYAELYIIKPVEVGRFYDTILEVTNKNGESRSVDCRIEATNFTAANFPAFPSYTPSPIVVPEVSLQIFIPIIFFPPIFKINSQISDLSL